MKLGSRSPIYLCIFSSSSPLPRILPKVSSSLYPRTKSHCVLVWRNSFPHHTKNHRPVGSQFAFLYCPYKLPTPVFCKLWFSSQSSEENNTIIFALFAHLPLFLFSQLQVWKLWFWSHIKIVTGFLWSLLSICSLRFQFNCGKTPRFFTHLAFLLLIWFQFLWDCDDFLRIVIQSLIYWWFDVSWSNSLAHWFHENSLTLWLEPRCNLFIQHIFDMIEPLVIDFKSLFWFLNYAKTIAHMNVWSTYHRFHWLFWMAWFLTYEIVIWIVICVVGCTVWNDYFVWAKLAPPPSHIWSLMLPPIPG